MLIIKKKIKNNSTTLNNIIIIIINSLLILNSNSNYKTNNITIPCKSIKFNNSSGFLYKKKKLIYYDKVNFKYNIRLFVFHQKLL